MAPEDRVDDVVDLVDLDEQFWVQLRVLSMGFTSLLDCYSSRNEKIYLGFAVELV